MSINDRIKFIRKHFSLNQSDFGRKIGVGVSAVSKLESGENNPSEQTIRAICSEFSVRRDWLESGEEPMLFERDEDDLIIDTILADEDDFVRAVLKGIAKTPGGWEKMRQIFTAIHQELDAQKKEPEE